MQNLILPALLASFVFLPSTSAALLRGAVVDAATNQPVAARLYIQDSDGKYFQVLCAKGTAVPYNVRRSDTSFEVHTTISPNSFHVDLPPGQYTVVAERGKEYFSESREVTVADADPTTITISLRRWTDMAAQGWYSGETHVHREVSELPTLQLAEDLNVAFPLTAWVTDTEHTPADNNKNRLPVPPAKLVEIDAAHVFWPVNTEYEIFTVQGRSHTLGAVFILNHREPLTLTAPPVAPIAAEARRQGAFLDLDKHNWPWSIMLMPQMRVDLFELTNNHLWRTGFLFGGWYPEYAAGYMHLEMVDGKFTERGWIDFGFQTYYALLNCGFHLKPTGGTATGVHPVPLGYGRVYVNLDGDFSYDKWVQGLLAGNSFVTTGPMLTASVQKVNQEEVHVVGQLESATEPAEIEVIVNGDIHATIDAQPQRTSAGAYRVSFETSFDLHGSSWVAVRAFAKRPDQRTSFAHTAPVHINVAGQPLRPTRVQRDYLAERIRDEITRNRGVVSVEAMREFEHALQAFQSLRVRD